LYQASELGIENGNFFALGGSTHYYPIIFWDYALQKAFKPFPFLWMSLFSAKWISYRRMGGAQYSCPAMEISALKPWVPWWILAPWQFEPARFALQ
jgi:hypothetical protein